MSFRSKLIASFQIIEARGEQNYAEAFELEKDLAELMNDCNLWNDVDTVSTADGKVLDFKGKDGKSPLKFPLGTELRLKKKVQQDLARTYALFTSNKEADKRFTSAKNAIVDDVHKIIKKVSKKLGVEPRGIQVKVEFQSNNSYVGEGTTAGTITISYKGEELEFEPEGLHYQADGEAIISDAAGSWNWVAWLGMEASPFKTEAFVESYLEDQISQWFAEAGNIEGDETGIENKLKDFLMDHEAQKKQGRA